MPDWRDLDAAFDRALDLEGEAQDAYLASLDAETRDALAPLLRDALGDDTLLDHRQAMLGPLAALPDSVGLGERVGPYRIESLVGEGGMGRVYRARRADGAFDATVAVKVVRQSLALAGSDVAARLRRERALLATLDHPGIARLIDGGETDDCVPYLVTEFVNGLPLTEYADSARLGVADRVRLVAEVARAVDHAHRRFVVHRDLKPSNVLVTERDGTPRPVVLDFGIAKLMETAEPKTGAFPLTQTGLRMLTPAYAAPELYEPTATITTAADVYGLGALLYEVLTGHRPHDDNPSPGPARTEPTRPSKIVTGSATPESPDLARRARALRGDLDVICLRALHPDPSRRYASAADLAADLADDLARTLDGRPVEARPDSWAYVASRFAKRHRALVAASAVALLALVTGLTVSVVSLGQARAETARAEEAADLLGGLLELGNVAAVGGQVPTARDLLDSALVRTERVESKPLRAYLIGVLARAFDANEDALRADSLLEGMLASLERIDADPAIQAEVLLRYATARTNVGETGAGHALLRRAHRAATPGSALHVRATNMLSWASRSDGDPDQGLRYAREALRLAADLPPDEAAAGTAEAYAQIGDSYRALLRIHEAISAYERVWALQRERFGARSVQSAQAASRLGTLYEQAGKVEEAGRIRRFVLATYRQVYGADDHHLAGPLAAMAEQLVVEGDLERAELLFDSSAAATERAWGPGRWFTPARFARLSEVRYDLGRYAQAEAAARRAVEMHVLKGDTRTKSFNAGKSHVALGRALMAQGREREGRRAFRRAQDILPTESQVGHDQQAALRRLRQETRAALARADARP